MTSLEQQQTTNGARLREAQAALLAEQGDFVAAIAAFKAAIAERPDCATNYEQLAQCLSETEQYPEAHQAASQACSLAPQVHPCTHNTMQLTI